MIKKTKTALVLLLAISILFSLSACAAGAVGVNGPSAPTAPTDAALNVIAMIDGIPEIAEDGSNASEVYDAYTAAQSAYFQLSYDEMNMVNNVGAMWKASDDYFNHIMNVPQGETYDHDKRTAENRKYIELTSGWKTKIRQFFRRIKNSRDFFINKHFKTYIRRSTGFNTSCPAINMSFIRK